MNLPATRRVWFPRLRGLIRAARCLAARGHHSYVPAWRKPRVPGTLPDVWVCDECGWVNR